MVSLSQIVNAVKKDVKKGIKHGKELVTEGGKLVKKHRLVTKAGQGLGYLNIPGA